MTFLKTILSILGIAYCSCLYGQAQEQWPDSVITIDEITITSSRLENYAVGVSTQEFKQQTLDIYKTQTLSQLLNRESGITIKSYGVGGLSTPSIRGGGSSHTPILWNGINLQSSMNGGVNLSLIPVELFNDIRVQYGGSSTLFGSGVLSGAIHIGNKPLINIENHVKATYGFGSFNQQFASANVKLGGKKLHSSLNVLYTISDNDFEYENTAKFGSPTERQSNAGYMDFSIIQNNEIRTGALSTLNTSLWFNHYDKDLQTLMIQSPSRASQTDNSTRFTANWQRLGNTMQTKVKTAFLYDELLYTDPDQTDTTSNHYTYSSINELENRIEIRENQALNIGLNYTYEKAISDGLKDDIIRNRVGLFTNYRIENLVEKLNVVLNGRQELIDSEFIPSVYSLGFDYRLANGILLKGNASRNYRIPTFNDLYWRTDDYSSGNPDLIPESGYNLDLGFKEYYQQDNFSLTISQDFYWTKTKNWIVWLPNSGGVWMPVNKNLGKSYGAEISYDSKLKSNELVFTSEGFFKYSHSELMDAENRNGKALLYEPKYSFNANLGIQYRHYFISYNHSLFSERKYDNQRTLDPYQLGSVYLKYSNTHRNNQYNISLNINNLWSEDYQIVAWYAMPPTNYQLNFTYQLNFKN